MSVFSWPFKRKTYPGVGNPRFVSDILAANEAVIDGLAAICGFRAADFAIVSGFEFTPGSPGTYAPGILWQGGSFYFMPTSFAEGLYIIPAPITGELQPFDDFIIRPIYDFQTATSSSTNPSFSPLFNGDMDNYRINLRLLHEALGALIANFATLGNSAFRNIGVVAGTVAAGDDSRFGYTQAQIDLLFAKKIQVLLFGNTTPFTPILDYEPATKKYVDTAGGMKLRWCGIIAGDGSSAIRQAGDLNVTVAHLGPGRYLIGHNLGSSNYYVTGIGYASSVFYASPRLIENLAPTSFTLGVSDDSSPKDWPSQLQIIQYFP